MIDMVKIGKYKSYLLERKSRDLNKSCFAMQFDIEGSQMIMIQGEDVMGRDEDKHGIMGYIQSVCTPKVRELLEGTNDINKSIRLLANFDFDAWCRFNHRIGNADAQASDWSQLIVRLIIDATDYRSVQLSLVTDQFVSSLTADLRDNEVSGDMLHRRLVPVYLGNPDISYEDAVTESESIDHPDSYILSQSRFEWERMQSRYAHLN